MRESVAEVFERLRAIRWIGGPGRQGQGVPLPRNRPQHGVDEPVRASLARTPRQLHGIVDHRRCGHAREVQQLIGAETQDLDDLRVETLDWPLRDVADHVVERRPPALHARGDFRGQGAVALVGERRTSAGYRGRQVRTASGDGEEDLVGGDARRRDHGAAERRRPASSGWPARKSRARIGFLPSTWSSTICSRPSPVATCRSSPRAATIVPWGASLDCGPSRERSTISR